MQNESQNGPKCLQKSDFFPHAHGLIDSILRGSLTVDVIEPRHSAHLQMVPHHIQLGKQQPNSPVVNNPNLDLPDVSKAVH